MTRRGHSLKIPNVYDTHADRSKSQRQRVVRQQAPQRQQHFLLFAVISAGAVNNSERLRTTLKHKRK